MSGRFCLYELDRNVDTLCNSVQLLVINVCNGVDIVVSLLIHVIPQTQEKKIDKSVINFVLSLNQKPSMWNIVKRLESHKWDDK